MRGTWTESSSNDGRWSSTPPLFTPFLFGALLCELVSLRTTYDISIKCHPNTFRSNIKPSANRSVKSTCMRRTPKRKEVGVDSMRASKPTLRVQRVTELFYVEYTTLTREG